MCAKKIVGIGLVVTATGLAVCALLFMGAESSDPATDSSVFSILLAVAVVAGLVGGLLVGITRRNVTVVPKPGVQPPESRKVTNSPHVFSDE